ncbi:MAG: SOS response-associated peptidase [Phycisphaerales bacterium JB063]
MCGRYALNVQARILEEQFRALCRVELAPRYNVAPSQGVLIVRDTPIEREATLVRWGLVPSWADDIKVGYRMINARSETAATNGAFKHALKRRRCLVVVSGFYEWKKLEPEKTRGRKLPHYIRVRDAPGGVFALGGLWEHWQDPAGNELESCAILTCEPNELMADLHDRMPVIIDPADYDRWLALDVQGPSNIADLLRPFPADRMEAWPVGSEVGSVKNDRPELIEPVPPPGAQGGLFSND